MNIDVYHEHFKSAGIRKGVDLKGIDFDKLQAS